MFSISLFALKYKVNVVRRPANYMLSKVYIFQLKTCKRNQAIGWGCLLQVPNASRSCVVHIGAGSDVEASKHPRVTASSMAVECRPPVSTLYIRPLAIALAFIPPRVSINPYY
jgi:hypothetical protein